mgnify:CR=1 FL=1
MEIILEFLFSFFGELLLQLFAEVLADLGVRFVSGWADAAKQNPVAAFLGYLVMGAVAGGLSLLLFREHMLKATWLRVVLLVVIPLVAGWLMREFANGDPIVVISNLNTYNLLFLALGMLLHWRPRSFLDAVSSAVPATSGILVQFPFYAGIAGIITTTHLNERVADLFVLVSTPATFPPLVAIYSAVLGVFVPSGGSKWVIEAPYVMAAAHELRVHLGWVVAAYDLGEAVANLVQPFWMLPVLGLFHLRARDVMGYTLIVFAVMVPVVLTLVAVLGRTLPYPL